MNMLTFQSPAGIHPEYDDFDGELSGNVDDWRDVDDDVAVVCDVLGLTRHRLLFALDAGASVGDIAVERDIDPQVVVDALVADQQEDLLDRLAHHELTRGQAAAIYARIADRAAALVARRVGERRPA